MTLKMSSAATAPTFFDHPPLSRLLGKNADQFQREDLIRVIQEHQINQLILNYVGLDQKLKELRVPLHDLKYANLILAQGERLDGSSVFRKVIDAGKSDLYVLPQYSTAFLSPFEQQTLHVFCRFLDRDGVPTMADPENVLRKAHERLYAQSGCELHALAEIEFYLIYDRTNSNFVGQAQRGYHQTAPFMKGPQLMREMMTIISNITDGAVKYAHAEVGYIEKIESENAEINGKCAEQYEIEFLPRHVHRVGQSIALAKWVIRSMAAQANATVTFAPKIKEGMAGTGLHFHLALMKNGINQMATREGTLSPMALQFIGGLLKLAPSLTAFGNSVASAFLRLVSHQEAPTRICWSEQNRCALVRIPLCWNNTGDLGKTVNPQQQTAYHSEQGSRQTIELRSPDATAHVNLLLAAITLAACEGLADGPKAQEYAQSLHVQGNIFNDPTTLARLQALPPSCAASAELLSRDRHIYEEGGIFSKQMIDYVIASLREEDDLNLQGHLNSLLADEQVRMLRYIMHKDLHKN